MSSTLLDDDEYPYSAKPPIVLTPREYTPQPQRRIAWRLLFGWAVRLALVGLVLLAIVTLPIAAIGYRAYRQMASVAELEDRGCMVGYSNEIDPDSLRGFLCDVFGAEYFDDVTFVSAMELHRPESAPAICRICGKFKKLESFSIQSDYFRFEQIASWRHLDNLTSLRIASSKITDADLLRISRMPKLTELAILSASISEAGLRHLSRLIQLESLEIEAPHLDGSGSVSEVGFPKLQSLRFVNSPQVGDQTIVNLGPLPELNQVILSETKIGDEAIAHVTAGGKLHYADFPKTQVTDQGLENLARCPELTMLDLSDTKISDAGVAKLQPCSQLTYLHLSGTNITGKGFGVLRGQLLGLAIARTKVTDDGLRDILKVPGLRLLNANETSITGSGAKLLSELPAFERLELNGAPLTEAGIMALALANTQRMDLCQTPLDDRTLLLFAPSDYINYLNICETKVTDVGVRAFYETRKQRLDAANRKELLVLECDFPDVVEPYLPRDEFGDINLESTQPESAPPSEREQPTPSEQPVPEQPQP